MPQLFGRQPQWCSLRGRECELLKPRALVTVRLGLIPSFNIKTGARQRVANLSASCHMRGRDSSSTPFAVAGPLELRYVHISEKGEQHACITADAMWLGSGFSHFSVFIVHQLESSSMFFLCCLWLSVTSVLQECLEGELHFRWPMRVHLQAAQCVPLAVQAGTRANRRCVPRFRDSGTFQPPFPVSS